MIWIISVVAIVVVVLVPLAVVSLVCYALAKAGESMERDVLEDWDLQGLEITQTSRLGATKKTGGR